MLVRPNAHMPNASLQTLSDGARAMRAVSEAIFTAADAMKMAEPSQADELRSLARDYRVKLMALEANIAVLRTQAERS
ncbi:hypothetical protein MMMDOFMJ_4668 [Methylobacterium gnaphalii]|uniref:Uncharacterized protein n=1 Tax=Methylobacterium gnaphalii TaxID=1010610 RepID=A0A512JSA0_9HYPH|nr:hypothetical protein MGN01_46750 [Methylobacterium gnaphalii]GJD71705.1 hypothetical protein MMMDOFMJ_4668 [Methylobacterium gnaphalii]GLS51814.1 hypothetical protein GCM10007885_46770 [Methylobacterium gnaphalii]